jgi:hypothetical protein
MTVYHVCANEARGFYEASNEQGARDAFAADAGYRDEADMVAQLEQPSEIRAEPAEATAAAALLRIEATIGDTLPDDLAELRRCVQGLADAVAETGALLAQLARGKSNGRGR